MANSAKNDDLKSLLQLIDDTFGIDRVLGDRGKDVVREFYEQSGRAFDAAYPDSGCMHLAIDPEGECTLDGYRRQPRAIAKDANDMGAKRVLELGCGQGFNTLILAHRLPEAEVVGVDLLASHIVSARNAARKAGLSNLRYEEDDLNALTGSYENFDLVFAVEVLSYARNLDAVAAAIAAALRPGGRFVMYDVHAIADVDSLPPDLARATRLYETSVAVTHGFHAAGTWEAALQRAGLVVEPARDLSRGIQPGLKRMQAMSQNLLGRMATRLALKVMPKYLVRNGITALLGPQVFRLPKRNQQAALNYQKIIATKPAG